MNRNQFGISADTVDVSFVYKDGDYRLKVIDDGRDELADCTLYADIEPTGRDDYRISGVWLRNNFSSNQTLLDGKRAEEAMQILRNSEQWREWADEEVRSMTGEPVGGYEPLRASDVVECGRRL